MTEPKYLRYPVKPLLHLFAELSNRQVSAVTGLHHSTIQRWRNDPDTLITEWEADHYAVKLGKHPSELWETWFEIDAPGTPIRGRRKRIA